MSFLLKLLKPALRWYINKNSKKSLPDYNASQTVDGIQKKIDIARDEWGIPHIFAQSEDDLFFAQGYAHAQDRLWQMEIMRRLACGRLAELFGKDLLDTDRILRTLGFGRLGAADAVRYKGQPIEQRLAAYAKGVNAFIAQCANLPAEMKLLGCKPAEWTIADSLAMGRFLAFQMSYGWLHQLDRAKLVQAVGEAKAAELFPSYSPNNPFALPDGIEMNFWEDGRLRAFDGLFLAPVGGSNHWSIAADKMETGSAVLCNDPHLLLNNPNIWVENHLVCPSLEVTGVSVAGIPFVLIGHNRHIAWGATLSFVDMQDIFIERFTSDGNKQYECGKDIRLATHTQEVIRVKGRSKPHIETVVHTHHGVIISEALGDTRQKLALASPVLMDNDMVLGFYKLNLATGWNDFVDACECIEAPSLNLGFADTEDNIGYYCTGKVPIRPRAKHGLPVAGYDGANEWTGFVPFAQMPHCLNPARGYVYTCNHKLVNDDYPHDLGDLYMNGNRAASLQKLLDEKPRYSLDDCKAWQNDFYVTSFEQWKPLFADLAERVERADTPFADLVRQAWRALMDWNAYLTADTVGGCIFQVIHQELANIVVAPHLSPELLATWQGKPVHAGLFNFSELWSHDSETMYRLLTNPRSAWHDGNVADLLYRALVAAVEYLRKHIDDDVRMWEWGELHTVTFAHALGAQRPFDEFFNIANIPMGGNRDTLNQQSFMPNQHFGGTICGASFRQVVNMGNFAESFSVVPLGQSGNLQSPHYQDQLNNWRTGKYKTMLWTREQIAESTRYKMSLSPRE